MCVVLVLVLGVVLGVVLGARGGGGGGTPRVSLVDPIDVDPIDVDATETEGMMEEIFCNNAERVSGETAI